METVTIKLSILGKFDAIEIETDKEKAEETISSIIECMKKPLSGEACSIIVKNVAINPRFITMVEVVGYGDIGVEV